MARIDALLDALVRDEDPRKSPTLNGAPDCATATDKRACLDEVSRFFGSDAAITPHHPVQADLAAIAFASVEAPVFEDAGPFLDVIGGGRGAGNDAFRLQMAKRLRTALRATPPISKTEPEMRAYMKRVADFLPGACKTYAELGAGASLASLGPAEHPDTAPCVEGDLRRPLGPGPTFGKGVHRAATASDVLMRGLANALRNGLPRMQRGAEETRAVVKECDELLAHVVIPAPPP